MGSRKAAIVVVAVALVAACADDDEASVSAPTTGPPAVPITTRSPQTTRPSGTTARPANTTSPATEPPAATAPPSTSDSAPPSTAPATVAPRPPAADLERVAVSLEPLVELPLLTSMATRPADGSMYFASQTGEVWRLANVDAEPELVLDLTDVVSPWLEGSERGLLGLAFGPIDGRLLVYYTDGDVDSHLVSYAVATDGRPRSKSRRKILFQEQQGLAHKGGGMVFDPDGTLYLALGDGGGSNGRDAQDHSKIRVRLP
jgi:glucose/arabinose dehydrogenase